jgi:hypothetical protein
VLEALFVALALATDPTGLVLLLQLLIANAPTSTKTIGDYWGRVGLLLGVGGSVWFCVLMFHISAVSGPSDVFPFRTRFLGIVTAIATRRRTGWSWAAARQINPIVLGCAVAGVASAGHKYFACGLIITVISMLWSAEGLCMKVHLVEVIGMLPFCWRIDKCEGRMKVIVAILVVGLAVELCLAPHPVLAVAEHTDAF